MTLALRLALLCSLKGSPPSHLQLDESTPPATTQGEPLLPQRLHGFTHTTERIPLSEGPWPLAAPAGTVPTLGAIEPTQPRVNALLDHGQRTHEPDVRDPLPTATGLFPFIVHEAHCLQAKQKDKHAWKTAHDANQTAPWGLTGYFLDPDLFQMLAHSARLPGEPLHIPTWRQAGCLTFHLQLSHVLRVGHLLALKAWRSLLYPSPARLPMC